MDGWMDDGSGGGDDQMFVTMTTVIIILFQLNLLISFCDILPLDFYL
jgi:hypothetical protein